MLFYQGRYVYINEDPRPPGRTTSVYRVCTNELHVEIARIAWYVPWRKYALFPAAETVWETRCLREMVEVLETLMAARRRPHL